MESEEARQGRQHDGPPDPDAHPNRLDPLETVPTTARPGASTPSVFDPSTLSKTVIAIPLLKQLEEERTRRTREPGLPPEVYDIIIDINLDFRGGREAARERVRQLVDQSFAESSVGPTSRQFIDEPKSKNSEQYVFARLEGDVIRAIVQRDTERDESDASTLPTNARASRAIYHIWPDFRIRSLTTQSLKTVKADAARVSFSALGEDIVWAVMDSGIAGDHPHFKRHHNLENLPPPLDHVDFAGTGNPLVDEFGHGTHVAGIIAGELIAETEPAKTGVVRDIRAFARSMDEIGAIKFDPVKIQAISGMAPKCKLLSLKVLDAEGDGFASNLIAAIEHIQQINGFGRRLRVHGVNMSVGYDFEPEWFACGQSPLCVEVDRLVRSGVVVVVAAGNTGYGWQQSEAKGTVAAGMDLTINDPGNAELAITVGSTHRDSPHIYGVSYFSSKGPTGDGRLKPDLVAPGEKILSCAAGQKRQEASKRIGQDCDYVEDSGTSMAAPHVSGVIAAFLSVRREFIGQAERVKEIFLATATDLKRERTFQGHGLVDLMRAIQSV